MMQKKRGTGNEKCLRKKEKILRELDKRKKSEKVSKNFCRTGKQQFRRKRLQKTVFGKKTNVKR